MTETGSLRSGSRACHMVEKDLKFFASLTGITSKAELAKRLCSELATYSIFDLQLVSDRLEREIGALPSPYRERVQPYFIEQYFLRYGAIMEMHTQGGFNGLQGDIKDAGLFRDFCRTVAELHRPPDEDDVSPFSGHFYFLVSTFYMFVLDEPGHPVGMPFPGGFKVRKREDGFYCPIRDREKDVVYSICNFCPAKQENMP